MFEGLRSDIGLARLKMAHVETDKEYKQELKCIIITENIKKKMENYSN